MLVKQRTSRTGFKRTGKHGFFKILSRHFHEGNCKDASYKVQILEKLEGNERACRNALSTSCTPFRK